MSDRDAVSGAQDRPCVDSDEARARSDAYDRGFRAGKEARSVSGGEDRDDERGVPCACLFDPDRQVEPVVECLYHERLRKAPVSGGEDRPQHFQGAIPGSDPGACPNCGRWMKAGMIHRCSPVEPPIAPGPGCQERPTREALLSDVAMQAMEAELEKPHRNRSDLEINRAAMRAALDSVSGVGEDREDRPLMTLNCETGEVRLAASCLACEPALRQLEVERDRLREAAEKAESALRDLSEGEIGDYPIEQRHVEEIAGPALDALEAALAGSVSKEDRDV